MYRKEEKRVEKANVKGGERKRSKKRDEGIERGEVVCREANG